MKFKITSQKTYELQASATDMNKVKNRQTFLEPRKQHVARNTIKNLLPMIRKFWTRLTF